MIAVILLFLLKYLIFCVFYAFPFYVIGVHSIILFLLCIIGVLFDTLGGIVNFIGWVISLFVIFNTPFSWFTVVYFIVFALYLFIAFIPGLMNTISIYRSQKG